MVHSILSNIDETKIHRDPFPYAVIENALPQDYYRALAASFPSPTFIAGDGELENNEVYRQSARDTIDDPEVPKIWQEFIRYHCSPEFFREFAAVWEVDVAAGHKRLLRNIGRSLRDFSVDIRHAGRENNANNRAHDVVLDTQFCINSPVNQVSSVRGPHTDSPFELFAALLYFRPEDDDSSGGDLELYTLKRGHFPLPKPTRIDPRHVDCVATVPYRANTLVMFINTPASIHGVTPRSVTEISRRYINFIGECYAWTNDSLLFNPESKAPAVWRKLMKRFYKHRWGFTVGW